MNEHLAPAEGFCGRGKSLQEQRTGRPEQRNFVAHFVARAVMSDRT
jgi:hypothetical protein